MKGYLSECYCRSWAPPRVAEGGDSKVIAGTEVDRGDQPGPYTTMTGKKKIVLLRACAVARRPDSTVWVPFGWKRLTP